MKNKATSILDLIGISSATLCLIHCLIFPILTIIPLGISDNHWVDLAFACIGMFVVSKIIMSDATRLVKIILSISITIVIIGVSIDLLYKLETNLVAYGGLIMLIGHFLNFKSHIKSKDNLTKNPTRVEIIL